MPFQKFIFCKKDVLDLTRRILNLNFCVAPNLNRHFDAIRNSIEYYHAHPLDCYPQNGYELLGDYWLKIWFLEYLTSKCNVSPLHPAFSAVATKLITHYMSKPVFVKYACRLGLNQIIRREANDRESVDDVCENTLESWFGLCVKVFGIEKPKNIAFKLFSEPIPLEFEDLYDAKTRLNALAFYHKIKSWGYIPTPHHSNSKRYEDLELHIPLLSRRVWARLTDYNDDPQRPRYTDIDWGYIDLGKPPNNKPLEQYVTQKYLEKLRKDWGETKWLATWSKIRCFSDWQNFVQTYGTTLSSSTNGQVPKPNC